MSQPQHSWPDRPTGRTRRRTRRLPPLVTQLEPGGIELLDDDDGAPEDGDQPPDGAAGALCGPEGDETQASGTQVADSDQGQPERKPRKRYVRDGVPLVDTAPPGSCGPMGLRPHDVHELRADVNRIMASVDAVLAEWDREQERAALRRQLDAGQPRHT